MNALLHRIDIHQHVPPPIFAIGQQAHGQRERSAVDATNHGVKISPSGVVKRQTAAWPGMAAEIVQATQRDRIESRFCAPVHLLALYERGIRHDGATIIEGLPKSTLRDFAGKLIFVPAGYEYHDWQEPRILTRVVYFYLDPTWLSISGHLGVANMPLAPRLFFEDSGLWDIAHKLSTLIENPGADHRPYVQALGIVMAHELMRFNAGKHCVTPQVRGGLAACQQRIVVAHIEDHLDEPISLATLAQLVDLSASHFCRAFKQSFGMPPHRYHNNRRIEHAKTLLAESTQSVTEIGLTVGFSQTSSFTAAFRKTTGLTPTAFQRSID
jgi:AraC family transcriptional regulator